MATSFQQRPSSAHRAERRLRRTDHARWASALSADRMRPLRTTILHRPARAARATRAVPATTSAARSSRSPTPLPGTVPGLGEKIEAVEIHHLVPGRDEVAHELLLR